MDVDEPARDGRGRENTSSRARRLLPLVLATMASQALLVVLAPTIVEVGREFGASVGVVGQARSALALGAFIAVQFNVQTVVWIALAAFFASAVAGGVRTPVSSALGLSQLPDQPGSMMAARTAVTMMGYLLGGLLGGATLAWGGYGALGLILAVCLALCAALVLRVSDPTAPKAAEPAVTVASEVHS